MAQSPDLQTYLDFSLRNLITMSRTANGIIDVSTSATKKDSMLILGGDEAAGAANRNFINALKLCYESKDKVFNSAEEVKAFTERIAAAINEGIVKDGRLIRNGEDSKKFNFTRIALLEQEAAWFYKKLFELLNAPDTDCVYLAAFVEYYINFRLHLYSDGCGKASMALAAYIFMRYGRLPVKYEGREPFYRYSVKHLALCGSPEDAADFEPFYSYYQTLV